MPRLYLIFHAITEMLSLEYDVTAPVRNGNVIPLTIETRGVSARC